MKQAKLDFGGNKMSEHEKCSICGGDIEIIGTWTQGHNAQPINDGRCCGDCNNLVIMRRLRDILKRKV